ncbi:MAG: DUF6152 family protein [Gammaproteobacteria bacterium]
MKKLILIACLGFSGAVLGHHSTLGFFDPTQRIEIEGVLTAITWANPHVRFEMDVTNEDGSVEGWHIETSAWSALRTRGLTQDFMQVGDRVRIAGPPSRDGSPEMNGRNVLLEDGTEVVMALTAEPYFTDSAAGRLLEPIFDEDLEAAARRDADGIFRVWSTVIGDPDSFPMFKGDYPLTEAAEAVRAAWNPTADALLQCWEKGMPMIMITPLPMAFERSGGDILIRFEEDDAERLVHMGANAPNATREPAHLGYSTGRWENETLVVETTDITALEFDDRGAPQTPAIELEERFTVSDDGNRLDYRLLISDPGTFAEDFDLTRYWVWRPEIVVGRWDCENPE